MKQIYTIVVMLVVSVGSLRAQSDPSSVRAVNIKMARAGESVTVAFTLSAGKKATKASYDLVVNPILSSRAEASTPARCQLPSVVIRGRRSKVLDARHELAAGKRRGEEVPQYMRTGEEFEYTATVPYQEWMSGGQLIFEGASIGCCSSTEVSLGLVADNILDPGPQIETRVVEVPTILPHTTGRQLAEQYTFVAPAAEFESLRQVLQQSKNMSDDGSSEIPQQVIAATRQGSVSIFFAQGIRTIDSNFGDNNRNLVELISAVRALAVAGDTKIAAIVIAGFSSPEGSIEFNDRLSRDRAVAVKDFLTENSAVDPGTIHIFNGGADWTGLKGLVERSDLPTKQRIIDIIDSTPVRGSQRDAGRLDELVRLDGGEPYRYMLTNFFPELRQAAYIKVYYEDK